ncbi:hypothetical protein TTHT_1464 [Thermotomaculum hydrothermale]|uniref:Uncharacterized protein n=1 Tax=Thermotomaculum hydrothermale TaxID=981385 RepID=A0A7R6SZQ0_9BACT|nr:hypothetical protein [Thermotomaculum hydrothermale]BBB32972.1 hypothetical protein TTHT_1464 [Thermotomaculum hydrothermale]
MKGFILALLIIFSFQAYSQNVDLIKKGNLFDPDRGYTEEAGEEVDTEKEVKLPSNIPVLDGIVVINDYKKAIFTYYDKEKKRKISKYHSVGEKFADASLKEITPDYVILVFDGKQYKLYPDTKLKAKKSRGYSGGSPRTTYTPPPKTTSQVVSRSPVKSTKKVKPKKPFMKPRPTFNRRRPVTSKVKPTRVLRPTSRNKNTNHRRKTNVGSSGSQRSNPFVGGGRLSKPTPNKTQGKRTNTPF